MSRKAPEKVAFKQSADGKEAMRHVGIWERAGCVNSCESLVSGPQLPLSGMVWEVAAVQSQPRATPAGDSSSSVCSEQVPKGVRLDGGGGTLGQRFMNFRGSGAGLSLNLADMFKNCLPTLPCMLTWELQG